MLFEKFPSLTRFSHGWTITEKLDGTNACVLVVRNDDPMLIDPSSFDWALIAKVGDFSVFAQSRKTLIYPGRSTDNHGFGQFVWENADDIVAKLGEGRHFGEWVGKGINKRHYNLEEKRFVLFNTHRWTGAALPDRVDVVPVLNAGYLHNPGEAAELALEALVQLGSAYAPGFRDPEGVVLRHGPSGTLFKKTLDYDEQGKWAENQARKEVQ